MEDNTNTNDSEDDISSIDHEAALVEAFHAELESDTPLHDTGEEEIHIPTYPVTTVPMGTIVFTHPVHDTALAPFAYMTYDASMVAEDAYSALLINCEWDVPSLSVIS